MHGLSHELRQSCRLGVLGGGHVVTLAPTDSESTGFYVKDAQTSPPGKEYLSSESCLTWILYPGV